MRKRGSLFVRTRQKRDAHRDGGSRVFGCIHFNPAANGLRHDCRAVCSDSSASDLASCGVFFKKPIADFHWNRERVRNGNDIIVSFRPDVYGDMVTRPAGV